MDPDAERLVKKKKKKKKKPRSIICLLKGDTIVEENSYLEIRIMAKTLSTAK